ncbi:MAG: hypothetical protein ICV83_09365 [Cytophagales bacterium]|nr:hypothetical protein [Cytophagales bacterium]
MKKAVVNAVLLVAISAFFVFLTTTMSGNDVGSSSLIVGVVLLAALVFDVYIFALKNPTRQITVRFNDPRAEERLHAILDVTGYRLKESQGNTRRYKPSFWIGGLNGKVTMEYAKDRVVITGPLFVIGRIEERLWLFSYPGILSWTQTDGRPEPHFAEAGFDYTHTEPVAPYGVNTGYEPGVGTVASGR